MDFAGCKIFYNKAKAYYLQGDFLEINRICVRCEITVSSFQIENRKIGFVKSIIKLTVTCLTWHLYTANKSSMLMKFLL